MSGDATDRIRSVAEAAGIRRVHLLGWRDLADIEAGGSEVYAAQVASIWARAGLDVVMRTSHAQGRPGLSDRDGYRVVRRGGRHSVFPRVVAEELLHRLGSADAMFEAWNGIPFLTPLWWRGPRLAIVHHVHKSMWPDALSPGKAKLGWFVEGTLAPPLYQRTPILAPSATSRGEIVELLGLPRSHITIAPPGVDERFSPGSTRSHAPLVVTVARLTPTKRVDRMLRIMNRVHAKVPAVRYTIVGDGQERADLEAQADALGARSWVRFTGRSSFDELRELYRQAWIVASASSAEGFGMTLTEAGACATPAVASDITGHRDAVEHGLSGLLATDDDDFVNRIVEVLTDHQLRARLSEGARTHAARHSWAQTAMVAFDALARGLGHP